MTVGYIQNILDKLSWSVRTMIFMRELGDIYSTFWAKVIFWLELNKTSKFHYKRNYIKREWKRKRRCIFIFFFFGCLNLLLHPKWAFQGEWARDKKERARKQAPIKKGFERLEIDWGSFHLLKTGSMSFENCTL
jgi:hypothetical protein